MKKADFEGENHTISNDNQSDSSSDEDETPSFFDIQNIKRKKFKKDENEITVIEAKNIIESDNEDETPSFFITTKTNDENEINDEDETPSFFVIDKTKVEPKAIDEIKDYNETQLYNETEVDDDETPSFFVNTKSEENEPKIEYELRIDTIDENKINYFAYEKIEIDKKLNRLHKTLLSKSTNPSNTSSLSLTRSGRSIKVLFSLTQSQNQNIKMLQKKSKNNNKKSSKNNNSLNENEMSD